MADPSKLVVAECPACGERRFRAEHEAPEPSDILTCESCGLKLSYAFLQSRTEPTSAAPEQAPTKAPRRRKKRKTPRPRKANPPSN
jgi:hypothetical protein